MIIQLTKEIRIRGTEHCVQTERRRVRKGKTEWRPFKYHSTYGEALRAACERELRMNPAVGLAESIEAATQISAKFGELFDCALAELAKRPEPQMQVA